MDIVEDVPWLGPLQITLGLAILFFSILILLHPIIGGLPLIILISFGLLFAGSEKIITGALAGKKKIHLPNLALGVGIMMIALLAFIFSMISTPVVTTLLGITLTIFGVYVIVFSGFGVTIAGILLGIVLLLDSILIFSSAIREKPSGEKLSPVT